MPGSRLGRRLQLRQVDRPGKGKPECVSPGSRNKTMKNIQVQKAALGSIFFILLSALSLQAQSQSVKEAEDRLMNQANQNIEKYRKGNVSVRFVAKAGSTLQGASLEVVQQTHDFLFGCIIFDLIRDENSFRQDQFKKRFKSLFNFAVFPFYWPGYESRQGMPGWADMLPVLEWCRLNGITTKGHPLVWACKSGTPSWLSGYAVHENS